MYLDCLEKEIAFHQQHPQLGMSYCMRDMGASQADLICSASILLAVIYYASETLALHMTKWDAPRDIINERGEIVNKAFKDNTPEIVSSELAVL